MITIINTIQTVSLCLVGKRDSFLHAWTPVRRSCTPFLLVVECVWGKSSNCFGSGLPSEDDVVKYKRFVRVGG